VTLKFSTGHDAFGTLARKSAVAAGPRGSRDGAGGRLKKLRSSKCCGNDGEQIQS
jgi:hypothetical protein